MSTNLDPRISAGGSFGWVQIHRTLLNHTAFRNDSEAMAFAWLIIRAAYKPARVRYREHSITLRRGQVAISIRDFAAAMDRRKGWIERLLKRLKSETMIETANETGVLVITICKYDKYQSEMPAIETLRETPPGTAARQGQDTEQRKEERKKTLGRATRLPEGFLAPGVWIAWAMAEKHWTIEQATSEAERFTRHFQSKAGKDGLKTDWFKAFQNWCTNQYAMPDGKPDAETIELTVAILRERAEFFRMIGQEDKAREHLRAAEQKLEAETRASQAA